MSLILIGRYKRDNMEEASTMMNKAFDAHCHLYSSCIAKRSHPYDKLEQRLKGLAIMATEPDDWDIISAIEKNSTSENIYVGFGLHPYFVEEYFSRYMLDDKDHGKEVIQKLHDDLSSHLHHNSSAIVGEIGLDRSILKKKKGINTVDMELAWSQQLLSFDIQILLASTYDRPVCLHIVRAWGYFEKYISDIANSIPTKILLHSFSGTAQQVLELSTLCKRRQCELYFSFSFNVIFRSKKSCDKKKIYDAIEAVPDDKLLIESDSSCIASSADFKDADVDDHVRRLSELIHIVSDAKCWSINETILSTTENALNFYKIKAQM